MTDLDHMLAQNQAPAPRGNLSAKILAAAETAQPANTSTTRRPIWAMGGVAAMAVMAMMFWVQPADAPETEWDVIADASGFSELYDWVEGDDDS